MNDEPDAAPPTGAPLPLWLEIYGWYGTAAILGAYFALSHGLLEEGPVYQVLNVTGAVGVGLVCLRRRAWSAMTLEFVWALVGISALVL